MGHSEKVLFMRVFIAVLVLIFSLQSWTKADDINDFEIEGMSIGDSLLDYYSKDKIIDSKINDKYKSKKFYQISIENNKFENYDAMSFHLKTNDNNFIIYSISGIIAIEINECLKKRKKIFNSIKALFNDPEIYDAGRRKHPAYKNGYTHDLYIVVNSEPISVSCYEFTDESTEEKLLISIDTKEFNDFLNNEAHN